MGKSSLRSHTLWVTLYVDLAALLYTYMDRIII